MRKFVGSEYSSLDAFALSEGEISQPAVISFDARRHLRGLQGVSSENVLEGGEAHPEPVALQHRLDLVRPLHREEAGADREDEDPGRVQDASGPETGFCLAQE